MLAPTVAKCRALRKAGRLPKKGNEDALQKRKNKLIKMNHKKKEHWEHVYETKGDGEVSWTEMVPDVSLGFMDGFGLAKDAKIIDVGGGNSRLVDCLLDRGFTDITVLDISNAAIEKTKLRLGKRAALVTWIVGDVLDMDVSEKYDVWHDRAAFHFLTSHEDIEKYVSILNVCVNQFLIMATFSTDGPTKCSGLPISQYDEQGLTMKLECSFEKLKCMSSAHVTPFDTIQHFLYCSFRKK